MQIECAKDDSYSTDFDNLNLSISSNVLKNCEICAYK